MEGPMRFRCPPEFEAVTPSPLPGLRGEALEGPSTELWLIRAPADFSPESLEGCTVPLDSCGQLQPSRDGDGGLYRLWGVPGGAEGTLLLAPASPPAGPLACAPPLRGCLTVTKSFGVPPGVPVTLPVPKPVKKKRKKTTTTMMKEPPEMPEVSTPGGAAPVEAGGNELSLPADIGVSPKVPKRKKKHKRERPE